MIKMSLQLFQTDNQSYLLDFRSISSNPAFQPTKSGRTRTFSLGAAEDGAAEPVRDSEAHTLEFFELCATLITELGR